MPAQGNQTMPIQCQICGESFPKLISSTHLKKHNISSADYKKKYGKHSLASSEYRQERSQKNSGPLNPNYRNKWTDIAKKQLSEKQRGREPWNKGTRLEDTSAYKEAAQRREKRYQSGELARYVHTEHSPEIKSKISEGVKKYANNNPEEMKARAAKSLNTRIKNGHDFGAAMRGRTHSAETKAKISKSSKAINQVKVKKANAEILNRAAKANISISDVESRYLSLTCNSCGTEFSKTKQYFHTSKFTEELCPTCFPRNYPSSKIEDEILEYVTSIYSGQIIRNNRSILKRREIDIWLPDLNLGIEVDGVFWHSELVLLDNGYEKTKGHQKYQSCKELGIQLITIYDIEWINSPEIVKSRLSAILNSFQTTIGARQTQVKELTTQEARKFLENSHLQGSVGASVKLGLVHNSDLVACMTFSKSNKARGQTGWEIARFATKPYTQIHGAASKLFKHFINTYQPDSVVSFSDNRWSNGAVYQKLGFELASPGTPGYWYFRPNDTKLYHRYGLRKTADDDQSLTEWQNRINQGWNRIWDCGHAKWVWTKEESGTSPDSL
jgi:hypothetical protein